MTVDGDDKPIAASVDGKTARIESCDQETRIENLGDDVLVTAPASMKMRWNIEIRHHTGWPVLLVEEGRLVGVVGDSEIYAGILRQTGFAEDTAATQD